MKLKRWFIVAVIALSIMMLFSVNIVYAPLSTLGTGYAVTSNYHGTDVIVGTPVKVTAATLDASITQVTFKWNSPNGTEGVWIDVNATLVTDGSMGAWNNGTTALIRYASSEHTPDWLGDWGVKVLFQGPDGQTKENEDLVVKIKATSFNVIPEVPYGTIAAASVMLIALGLFIIKKRRVALPPRL